jgi:hypothetical protein
MPKLTSFPRGASQPTPRSEFGTYQKWRNYKAARPYQLRISKSHAFWALRHAAAFFSEVKHNSDHFVRFHGLVAPLLNK